MSKDLVLVEQSASVILLAGRGKQSVAETERVRNRVSLSK